jgi:branched-chain amino acid transport system ATP-binding protein
MTSRPNVSLEAEGVSIAFGGVKALSEVSFRANPGEILGIIGPNGAGKSTLFSVITGFLRPQGGTVRYRGRDIAGERPDKLARIGLVRTWQTPRAFASLTVRENVTAAAVAQAGSIAGTARAVDRLLEEMGLAGEAAVLAADLPPAFRKRLEIARALARSPRVLLLDEVMAGLTSAEIETVFEIVRRRVARDGLTVVLIEHVIRAVRALCGRVIVLSGGKVIAEGTPADVMARPVVVEAYLGSAEYLKARAA